MIISLFSALQPYVGHSLMRVYHVWTVLQTNKVYGAISESAPGLI